MLAALVAAATAATTMVASVAKAAKQGVTEARLSRSRQPHLEPNPPHSKTTTSLRLTEAVQPPARYESTHVRLSRAETRLLPTQGKSRGRDSDHHSDERRDDRVRADRAASGRCRPASTEPVVLQAKSHARSTPM